MKIEVRLVGTLEIKAVVTNILAIRSLCYVIVLSSSPPPIEISVPSVKHASAFTRMNPLADHPSPENVPPIHISCSFLNSFLMIHSKPHSKDIKPKPKKSWLS